MRIVIVCAPISAKIGWNSPLALPVTFVVSVAAVLARLPMKLMVTPFAKSAATSADELMLHLIVCALFHAFETVFSDGLMLTPLAEAGKTFSTVTSVEVER